MKGFFMSGPVMLLIVLIVGYFLFTGER